MCLFSFTAAAITRGHAAALARRWSMALLLGLAAVAAHAQPGVLAPGNPPLTQALVDELSLMYGEIVGIGLHSGQRQRVRDALMRTWQRNDPTAIGNAVTLAIIYRELNKLPPPQRAAKLAEFRAQYLPLLREAAQLDADARWLYGLYEQAQARAGSAAPPVAAAAPGSMASSPGFGGSGSPAGAPAFGAPPAPASAAPAPAAPAPPAPITAAPAMPVAPAQAAAPPAPAAALPEPARSSASTSPGGVTYTPPAGWGRREIAEGVVFEAMLRPEPNALHRARIAIAHPQPAPRGAAAAFDAEWRRLLQTLAAQGSPMDLRWVADKPYYRGRLPGGITVYYMGRMFDMPNQTQRLYAVVYVLDLGDRTQTISANTVGGSEVRDGWGISNPPAATDHSAHWALAQALHPLLDSIRASGRPAAGPLFSLAEVAGNWRMADFNSGSDFYNRQTGNFVGTQFSAASSQLALNRDGSYRYTFWLQGANPVAGMGTNTASEQHDGRWSFADDVVTWQPRQRLSYDPRRKVVGGGVRDTPQGPRRLLIVVAPVERQFKPIDWVPLWDRYDGGGAMNWYVEEQR